MIKFLLFLSLIAAFTYFLAWVSDYNRMRLIWAALIPPALLGCYWLFGIGYINSSWCEPIEICDGGGMLAFTANTLVMLMFVVGASFGGVLAYWLKHRTA